MNSLRMLNYAMIFSALSLLHNSLKIRMMPKEINYHLPYTTNSIQNLHNWIRVGLNFSFVRKYKFFFLHFGLDQVKLLLENGLERYADVIVPIDRCQMRKECHDAIPSLLKTVPWTLPVLELDISKYNDAQKLQIIDHIVEEQLHLLEDFIDSTSFSKRLLQHLRIKNRWMVIKDMPIRYRPLYKNIDHAIFEAIHSDLKSGTGNDAITRVRFSGFNRKIKNSLNRWASKNTKGRDFKRLLSVTSNTFTKAHLIVDAIHKNSRKFKKRIVEMFAFSEMSLEKISPYHFKRLIEYFDYADMEYILDAGNHQKRLRLQSATKTADINNSDNNSSFLRHVLFQIVFGCVLNLTCRYFDGDFDV